MEKEDQGLVPEGEGLLSGGLVLMIVLSFECRSFGTDSNFAWVDPPFRDTVRNESRGRLADCFG